MKQTKFQIIVKTIANVLNYIGLVLLAVMMLLGAADVVGRYIFNRPIIGTQEISEVLLGSMTMLGWAATQTARGHVNVDLVTTRLSPRSRALLNFGSTIVGLILFILIAWQAVLTARLYNNGGRLIYTINWPLAPFQLLVSLGAVILCLVFITDLIQYARELKGGK